MATGSILVLVRPLSHKSRSAANSKKFPRPSSEELNISTASTLPTSPEECLRTQSFALRDQQFYALVLIQMYSCNHFYTALQHFYRRKQLTFRIHNPCRGMTKTMTTITITLSGITITLHAACRWSPCTAARRLQNRHPRTKQAVLLPLLKMLSLFLIVICYQ